MILVTGASGHLGNVVVKKLLMNKEKVRVFVLPDDDMSSLKSLELDISRRNLTVSRGDVRDIAAVEEAVKGCDQVIHCAALISIGRKYSYEKMYEVNVVGVQNIINACIHNHIKKLVYISSVHAFNESKDLEVITEVTTTNPDLNKDSYSKTKAAALKIINQGRRRGLDIAVVYPSGIIGPYDYKGTNNAMIPIKQLINSKKKIVPYIKGGYDFVDVRDVVDGIFTILKEESKNENYILSGQYISLKDIYTIVAKALDKKIKLICVPRFLVQFGIAIAYLFKKDLPITPYALKVLSSTSKISHSHATAKINYHPMQIETSFSTTIS